MKENYIAYEYKKISVDEDKLSMYLDNYEAFGWEQDENLPPRKTGHTISVSLKRDRKRINRAELTRLQRHFDACAAEIDRLEKAKTSQATIWALVIGLIGTAFMAGSVFAVTHEPPIIWLCILLAVPAFAGWILPYFLYRSIAAEKERQLQPLIEEKQEEIYEICEKGHSLL